MHIKIQSLSKNQPSDPPHEVVRNIFVMHAFKWYIIDYYSFKIIPRFWLVKSTRIIHHNQLPLTKFGKNFELLSQWRQKFCHVEPMTSKWRQKCSPLQAIEPLTERTWGRSCVFFLRAKWQNSFKNGEIFERIIKLLMNSVFVGYEEFWRSRRVLSAQNARNFKLNCSL